MYALDFIYDSKSASDFGLMICTFNRDSGAVITSNGGDLQFNLVKTPKNDKFYLHSTSYADACTVTFQICKEPCKHYEPYFTPDEVSKIKRWLCRKDGFHKFQLIQEDHSNLYFYGSFNVHTIQINGQTVGLELTFYSNAPYGYLDGYQIDCSLSPEEPFTIYDVSDETGSIYTPIQITCLKSGNLKLTNSFDGKSTVINNVTKGELICLDMEKSIITSSNESHDIVSDFNYSFFKISNSFEERENIITTTLPCQLYIDYAPIRKIGVE